VIIFQWVLSFAELSATVSIIAVHAVEWSRIKQLRKASSAVASGFVLFERRPRNRSYLLLAHREALWRFWDKIPYEIIAVNYLALRKNSRLYETALSSGIKQALDYSGACVSVLLGDNWLLDHTPVRKHFDDITAMGFDAATTHDDYVYSNDPSDHRFHRIHKALDRARELTRLNPRFKVIGIVKGSTKSEIEFCMDRLTNMNISMVAFPCSELAF